MKKSYQNPQTDIVRLGSQDLMWNINATSGFEDPR
jgi:hypothetical protein